ncbi:Zinc transporter [Friedmanniomyces endolithicus]|uniref:Zinc transporter n=1 Tax=Friedmanniomyces endolithicus TaxID=329885 RepID=A0AAN6QJU6_9PEZI|nr:Zinc transporter [Friedmanniomyces endolithicus]KAK0813270.1 Zinc transporter [Friedmanniomyces endolithicus]KAK0815956.1 Zinc transporter [Friedmanniomyces endolithicus]KAK0818089.1 Zinc transporter [Friedmanniomyces endolithicus]KAK0869181.1 Zinc transporter [Friedmanniomyces endolithicus]
MGLSNDERGWVMTCLSGIACVLGASIICVDIIVRQFPGKKNFRIQDSDTFLSASLSLSFGVMLFSALYSMLPSAKSSLQNGGFTPKQASWILIGGFLGGVIGITIISRVIHHFIPSHIVDCEHTHDEEERAKKDGPASEDQHHTHDHEERPQPRPQRSRMGSLPGHMHRASSDWKHPSRRSSYFGVTPSAQKGSAADMEANQHDGTIPQRPQATPRRPSMQQRLTSTISQITYGRDRPCDCTGSCYGYSEPCGQECFKNVNARGGYRAPARMGSKGGARPPITKSASMQTGLPVTEATPLLQNILEEDQAAAADSPNVARGGRDDAQDADVEHGPSDASSTTIDPNTDSEPHNAALHRTSTNGSNSEHHHHHVPTNAFLSIGLQTSIAIALHKLPEGFITYATNHANPSLGFAVFLALFIHNITEGFAMALPLYLAINSRWKAMLVSFVLGGLSQPIGAAVAAVWFKLAGNGSWAPSEGVYGAMFAVTAGIMASVALQLFSESLDLTHSKMLCMVGAFTGMGVLGISSALTA